MDSSSQQPPPSSQHANDDDNDHDEEASAVAEADAAAAATAAADNAQGSVICYKLTNGYVEPFELPAGGGGSGSAAAPAGGEGGGVEVPTAKRRRAFLFHNRNLTDDILLFGNQVTRLIDELPNAYAAHRNQDYSYRFELAKSKGQLVTLEVTRFNERTYLFLKKYFKPRLGSGPGAEINEASDWIPTPAVISLDTRKDNPQALLKFVLSAHRRLSR
jgi:hypothetical protein